MGQWVTVSGNSGGFRRVGDVSIWSHWLAHESYWLEYWGGEWLLASLGLQVFGSQFWWPYASHWLRPVNIGKCGTVW